MNKNGANHPTQINELLYIPRSKGGRGLKCIEEIYKEKKIKSAVKLVLNPEAHMSGKIVSLTMSVEKSSLNIFRCNEVCQRDRY